jgi:hypothetical protein
MGQCATSASICIVSIRSMRHRCACKSIVVTTMMSDRIARLGIKRRQSLDGHGMWHWQNRMTLTLPLD